MNEEIICRHAEIYLIQVKTILSHVLIFSLQIVLLVWILANNLSWNSFRKIKFNWWLFLIPWSLWPASFTISHLSKSSDFSTLFALFNRIKALLSSFGIISEWNLLADGLTKMNNSTWYQIILAFTWSSVSMLIIFFWVGVGILFDFQQVFLKF